MRQVLVVALVALGGCGLEMRKVNVSMLDDVQVLPSVQPILRPYAVDGPTVTSMQCEAKGQPPLNVNDVLTRLQAGRDGLVQVVVHRRVEHWFTVVGYGRPNVEDLEQIRVCYEVTAQPIRFLD